jgi:hypothetical protein
MSSLSTKQIAEIQAIAIEDFLRKHPSLITVAFDAGNKFMDGNEIAIYVSFHKKEADLEEKLRIIRDNMRRFWDVTEYNQKVIDSILLVIAEYKKIMF